MSTIIDGFNRLHRLLSSPVGASDISRISNSIKPPVEGTSLWPSVTPGSVAPYREVATDSVIRISNIRAEGPASPTGVVGAEPKGISQAWGPGDGRYTEDVAYDIAGHRVRSVDDD